jgi:glycosyltransferase involved in cell wall biosynthesis
MKINIVDPGLIEKAGHHFDFGRKLLRYLSEAGHDVTLFAYTGLADDAAADLRAYGKVETPLRAFQYGNPQARDRYASALDTFLRNSEILAEDLSALRPADVWLWPSFRAFNLYGCALAKIEGPVVGCIHVDPGIEARTTGAMLWRAAFLAASRHGLRYAVGSIEPELRHRFTAIIPDGRFAIFPQPFDGPPIDAPRTELKRIGVFGQQRAEKGTRRLSSLFDRLVADGYAVTLQNSNPRYQDPSHPQVKVLPFVEDFAEPIRDCDLVVLPYDIDSYAGKGSGILAQATAVGIPVVGPLGTLPGRIIEKYQLGPLFGVSTADAIYAAVKRAQQDYPRYAGNAFNAAHGIGKHYGAQQFAEALLACAAQAEDRG